MAVFSVNARLDADASVTRRATIVTGASVIWRGALSAASDGTVAVGRAVCAN
jgi:hypothetical protein